MPEMSEPRQEEQLRPPEDLDQLAGVLLSFNSTTDRLRETYDNLKSYISSLSSALEENLQEKDRIKSHLENILESVSCGIIVTDMQGSVRTVNRSAGGIWGSGPFALVGRPASEVFGRLEGWEGPRPEELSSPEGLSPVEASFQRLGDQRRHFLISACPLFDRVGKRTGTVTILEEVTRLKRLERQIQRANQLAAMGEMVAALAHEIRNPLGSIELQASMMEKQLAGSAADGAPWRESLEHILRGVRSLNLTVSNMLLINQEPPSVFTPFDLAQHLSQTLGFLRPVLEDHSIEAAIKLEDGLPPALGDKALLGQVWLNLMQNAVQAMTPDGGRLDVEVRSSSAALSPAAGERSGNGSPRQKLDAVEVRISDTGHGIEPSVLDRIFHPFFTTRPRGTGLGLAIVHKIVEAHRGLIDVESRPAEGTTFTIILPSFSGTHDRRSNQEEASYGRRHY